MHLFRPCIDIHQGKVKQIVGSSLKQELQENFISKKKPTYFARLYQNFNLKGGHVIMLSHCDEDKKAVRELIHDFPNIFTVGGGITNENAEYWIEAGAKKVIFSSYLFSSVDDLEKKLQIIKKLLPRERIVFDVSCVKKNKTKGETNFTDPYFIAINGWNKISEIMINRANLNWLGEYASEFLVHAVAKEGKKKGIDENLVMHLADNSPIPSLYAGGVSSYADIEKIKTLGKKKVFFTVGSALDIFGGELVLEKVVSFSKI